jgi:hypothetical protein
VGSRAGLDDVEKFLVLTVTRTATLGRPSRSLSVCRLPICDAAEEKKGRFACFEMQEIRTCQRKGGRTKGWMDPACH